MPRPVFPLSCLLVAALSLGAAARPDAQAGSADTFAAAEKLAAAGEFSKSLPLYQQVSRSGNETLRLQASYRLLVITQRMELYEQAVRNGKRCLALLRGSANRTMQAEVSVRTGMALEALGQYDEAENYLATAETRLTAPGVLLVRLQALSSLARVAEQIHEPAEAGKRWRKLEKLILTTFEEARAPLRPEQGRECVWVLCDSLFFQKRHAEAIKRLSNLLENLPEGKDEAARVDTSRRLADHYRALGRYDDAARTLRQAVAVQEKLTQTDFLLLGGLYDTLGDTLARNRKPAEAEAARNKAAESYLKVVQAKEAASPVGRTQAFWRLQRLHQKLHQYQQALALIVGLSGDGSGIDAVVGDPRLKAKQATLHFLLGSYKEAKTQFQAALASLERGDPLNLVELPRTLNNLGVVEQAVNNLEQAEKYGQRALELYRKYRLPADETVIETWNLLGTNAALKGQFAQGIERFREGAALCKKLGGKSDRLLSGLLLNQALLHKAQSGLADAARLCQEALAVYQRSDEPDELGVALFQCALASLHADQGRYAEASKLAQAVLRQCDKHKIAAGPLVSTSKHCRALGHLQRRELDAAEKLWDEVRHAQEKSEQFLLLPRTLNYLGLVAELRNTPDRAEKWYRQAAAVQQKQVRSIPSTRFVTLWRLANLLDRKGKRGDARAALIESIELVENARQKTYGDAQQRTTFLAQFVPAFEQAVQWSLRDGKSDEAFNLASRVRSRAFLDQLLMAGADPRETLAGPNGEALRKQERQLLTQVSSLRAQIALVPADRNQKARSKQLIADLEKAQQEYAVVWREILNASPLYRGLTDESALVRPLSVLRKKVLRPGTAVLTYHLQRDRAYAMLLRHGAADPEVFELRVPVDLLADLRRPIPAASPAVADAKRRGLAVARRKIVDVGRPAHLPAGTLDVPLDQTLAWLLVDSYRCLLESPDFGTRRGLKVVANVTDGPKVVRGLPAYAEVVLPAALRKRIGVLRPEVLFVVPDGVLHKLPLESLLVKTDPRPTFVLDELPPMIYAPSVSALAYLAGRSAPPAKGPPSLLTVSNPAYPLPKKAAGKSHSTPLTSLLSGALPRLPFTAEEARRIKRFFPAGRLTSLDGERATEELVTAAIPRHSYIHLAAHGYADERFGNLFGALALVAPAGGKVRPENDGFLSLVEVYRLPLSRCELAVLSACETNVGPQQPLEAGVTLASGFLAAGARRVVASHWSVDDRSTADLMGTFFEEVMRPDRKGLSYAAALQRARKKLREQEETSSPFYWAPFVLLGTEDQAFAPPK